MLEILIAYIKATFENSMPNITEVQGLAEKITEGDTQYPAIYCTGGEYKHLSALENYLYFRQTGSATEEESEEESTSGCAYMIRRTYPMVAVAYIPKSVYNTDNAFIDGKIAQNIANIITKANWQSLGVTLKTENIYAEVGEINTNRHEVWASEYRGVEFAARLDHVFVSVEFDIVVEASESCLQNYDCNDETVTVEGDTIVVEISDPDAWHKNGDLIGGVKKLGSLDNHDWQIVRGGVVIATIQAAGVNLNVLTAKATPGTIFLTTDAGVIKSRTAAEVRSDIGAGTGSVTSVGLLAGTSGTDVNITGSPITGAGNITINIPDASATNRGLVTIGAQTFAGNKSLGQNGANATGTADQRGSYIFSLKGSSWDGAAAQESEITFFNEADTTQNNFPRLRGLMKGNQFIRVDTSSDSVTYPGIGHTSLGFDAGMAITTGYHNVFIGGHAGQSFTTGYQNTAVGNRSLSSNTTGIQNVSIGQGSLFENLTSNQNVAVGFHAGLFALGGNNVFVGWSSGMGVLGSTAAFNTAIGEMSLNVITTGNENTAIGRNALRTLTSGVQNSSLGEGAGFSITTGRENVFIGYRSGYTNTAANATTTGIRNVFIGYESGQGSATQLTGAVAIGYRAKVTADNTIALGSASIVGVVIGNTAANASALFQVDSTTKGLLPPRMTSAQKNAISSPTAGLIVYDTSLNKLCVYTTAWETITSA